MVTSRPEIGGRGVWMKEGPKEVSFRTRFLVRGEEGYEISGNPGVGVAVLPSVCFEGEGVFAWYRQVVAEDTSATVSSNDSLSALEDQTLLSLGINPSAASSLVRQFRIGSKSELAEFNDSSVSVSSVVQLFPKNEMLFSFVMLNNMAGEVLRGLDKDLRYYIRSNEQGHNVPHVHVCYRNEKHASLSIVDGKTLAGELPKRVLRRATDRIAANQEKLLQYWNANTNGIYFDINYFFQAQDKALV